MKFVLKIRHDVGVIGILSHEEYISSTHVYTGINAVASCYTELPFYDACLSAERLNTTLRANKPKRHSVVNKACVPFYLFFSCNIEVLPSLRCSFPRRKSKFIFTRLFSLMSEFLYRQLQSHLSTRGIVFDRLLSIGELPRARVV